MNQNEWFRKYEALAYLFREGYEETATGLAQQILKEELSKSQRLDVERLIELYQDKPAREE